MMVPPFWRTICKGWLSLQTLASGRSPCFSHELRNEIVEELILI